MAHGWAAVECGWHSGQDVHQVSLAKKHMQHGKTLEVKYVYSQSAQNRYNYENFIYTAEKVSTNEKMMAEENLDMWWQRRRLLDGKRLQGESASYPCYPCKGSRFSCQHSYQATCDQQ